MVDVIISVFLATMLRRRLFRLAVTVKKMPAEDLALKSIFVGSGVGLVSGAYVARHERHFMYNMMYAVLGASAGAIWPVTGTVLATTLLARSLF